MLGNPRTARVLAVVVVIVFVVGIVLSVAQGSPRSLPAVALGWAPLFHLERATVGTALVAGLLVVLLNLLRGELPSKLSTTGVEWPTTAPDPRVQEQLIQALRSAEEAIRGLSTLAARPSASPEEKERLTEVQQSVEKMDAALDEAALRDAIADAIAELPDREKLVVALHYYEGASLQDIADALGVSASRASQIRSSAVCHLREKLGSDPQDFFGQG